ncbi:DUF4937 domain-containing protein [Virgisporangium aliadipatigenens]|uniref:DUF4937 domain-containing protein n=1 Tax=Virgisporangium aliadipatigenens TaxID=741659 RepID=A0A8J4DQW9_9ACTN|nr:DUF4937 domain-containing protein [Virgisporangium aliadipatigenens]GIJ46168.1 DUF4937 domain-containing protein [Virgisporangium aliadipatigenens]
MLIKWVVVRVGDRAAFHRGQQGWVEARRCAGFIGQCGGWSRRFDGVAHIVGGWADEAGYRAFMAGAHDGIAAGQAGTYHGTEVRLFEHRLDVGAGLFAATGSAELLRLAHCRVPVHRRAEFVEARNAAMTAAPGMLGCAFAQDGATEFLVLSRWRTVTDHDRHAADCGDAIAHDLVDLEPSWTVP